MAGAVLISAAAPAEASVPARVQFRITDPRIDEASGIAVGSVSPGIVYVENDSGDTNRFFALNATTGATSTTVTVPGATDVDWEDIAAAPDAAGTPSVWLADIGDNDAARREIEIYRVAEPHLFASDRGRNVTSEPPQIWRLRYPDGPVDAESFAVTPHGVGYLVTKSISGNSVVYRLPAHPDATRVQTLGRVGVIHFVPTDTPGPFGVFGELTATGAAISPAGSLLAVRTYTDAYLWRLRGEDVAAALMQAPIRVPLPRQPQGEGIAIEGRRLLIDSEGVGTPVYSIPIPAAALADPSSGAPTPARSTSGPTTGRSTAAAATPTASDPVRDGGDPGSSPGLLAALAAGVAGLGAAVVVTCRRRRRAG